MPFTEKDLCVAKAVICWLNNIAARSEAEAAESLLAASQCVQSAFGIEDGATSDVDLERVVCGCEEKKPKVEQDEQFMEFVKILSNKGFFAGVEEGSDEYNKRMQLARGNFDKMRASKAAAKVEQDKKCDENPSEQKQVPVFVSKEDEAKAEELKAQGNEALKAGQTERAAELYAEASKLNPNNAIYHSNRAAALMTLNRCEEAVTECETAIKLNPSYARSYSRLGAALHKLGRYQEALDRGYNKALELEPTNATVKENIEVCQREMKEQQHRSAPGAAPGGMPDLSNLAQMMQNPEVQEQAKKVAEQLGLGGKDGEGDGPAFDPSKMSEMMNNPMLQQMMNNPMVQQMAQNIASNPEMMNNLASMFSSMMGGAKPPQ